MMKIIGVKINYQSPSSRFCQTPSSDSGEGWGWDLRKRINLNHYFFSITNPQEESQGAKYVTKTGRRNHRDARR